MKYKMICVYVGFCYYANDLKISHNFVKSVNEVYYENRNIFIGLFVHFKK